MKSLSREIVRCAETGEGYRFSEDVVLYPITVSDLELFYACMPVLTLRQSTLPAAYAAMPFAEAIFAMALTEEYQGTEYGSCYARFANLLALSMRVPIQTFANPIVDARDYRKLKALIVKQTTADSEELIRLDTRQLGQIRSVIAALNGKDIPDESENAEIIEAESVIRSSNGIDLNVDVADLKASVSAYYHVRMRELSDWTIYEFEKARSAIERMTRCVICGIGEAGGMVKYEKGNPFPSLFFDRKTESPALIGMADFQRRVGGAVAMADGLPDMPIPT